MDWLDSNKSVVTSPAGAASRIGYEDEECDPEEFARSPSWASQITRSLFNI